MKFGVVIFPGSNCDKDLLWTIERVTGAEAVELWHKDTDLRGCDFIFLPGGFSYGDYLRSGAIARLSPVMQSIREFAEKGGFVLGICNGFQILCESGLLEGALLRNADMKFICKNVQLLPQNSSLITSGLDRQRPLSIPIAHGEGRFYIDDAGLERLKRNDQIVFRYCDEKGNITPESNPNGSLENIAGICNAGKNVFGMMPHPERAADPDLLNTDGLAVFHSILSLVSPV
jgi:phosphoribosylformylglycinamidine synthase I